MPEKFEVVISGVSGRFPECDDLETFKHMLYNQESPITYDNRKWPVNYKFKFGKETVPLGTGKFTDIQRFDARVFACSAALAKCTDIINRKVLEPSFEAVMDAGINPTTLMGANVGCYMSSCINEVEPIKIFTRIVGKLFIVGGSKAMCSNRVSFALNLTGPSFTFGGGIYGGLEALTAAYQNIAEGRIESAIVGGSSSIIDPKLSVSFVRLGFLSPDAVTRSFDADANGYGRSEGAVVLFLQRAQDAKRSYGTVRISDSFYYGMNPYTFIGFNEDVMETCIREIYANNAGGVKPSDISFLEMDACGVKLREKQETEAVSRIFCSDRRNPLLVGSVKSHSGHSEGASAYFSLVKCLLALDSGYIAPNMNFNKLNPDLKQIEDGKLKVVTEKTKLPGRMVGVNALSLFGVTSHAVIEQNPKEASAKREDEDTLPRLLIFCGRTEADMKKVIEKVEALPLNKEFVYISNDVFKTPMMTHVFRGYTIIPPVPQVTSTIDVCEGENRPIWFVFSGMGSQWNGMGKALLNIPIFAETIDQCDAVLKPKGIDIREIITADEPTMFDNIVHAFVGIISVQMGLVKILKALGIEPDGIIGHSVGENACAYADGCLTLEQAVLASYARGIASNEAETIKGMMAAIGRGYHQIRNDLPEGIEVACHNSHDNCTLTGPAELVNKFVEKLQEEKIFARAVNVSNIAYHSRHIAPAAPHLLRRLNEVIVEPKSRSSKWISTSVPEDKWDTPLAKTCSAEYLTNNLVSPVLFEEGCKFIPENAIVIEIAPHGLLQAILKRSLHKSCTNISLTLRSSGANSVGYLLSSIGKMYIAGCQPDVNALFPKIDYPVSRGTPSTATLATWDHSETFENITPARDRPLSEEILTVKLNEGSEFNFLKGHEIKNQKIIPSSLYMYFVWYMFATIKNEKMDNLNIIFENIKVHRDLHITLEKPRRLTLMIQYGSGDFEMLLTKKREDEEPVVIMSGTIQIAYENKPITIDEESLSKCQKTIDGREFYEHLENLGYKLEDNFTRMKEITCTDTECFGKFVWNENWICFLDGLMKFHIYSGLDKGDLFFPVRIRRLEIHASEFKEFKTGDEVICHKDLVTRRIRCNGLEMVGFVYDTSTISTFLDVDSLRMKMEAMSFISYSEPLLKNKETFLGFCLELAIESLILSTNNRDTKIKILDTTDTMIEEMKKVVKQRTELKSTIIFSKSAKVVGAEDTCSLLVISHDLDSLEKLQLANRKSKPLFALTLSTTPMRKNRTKHAASSFVEITKQSFDDVDIHLYKELGDTQKYPPPVINASDGWVSKFLPTLEAGRTKPLIVIRRNIEQADLNIILTEQKLHSNIRYIFLMDNQAPSFSIENPFYRNQIQRDLPINILKGGHWGSYRNTENYVQHNSSNANESGINYHDFRMKDVDLKYIAEINQKPYSVNDVEILEECCVEYSGIRESGERLMGLGKASVKESKYTRDPHLTWFVPEDWTLKDACTVPLAYLQINHILFTAGNRFEAAKPSVFVNSNDLFLKEACIYTALYYDFDIFLTVSDDEKATLLRKFPKLKKSNLLNQTNYKYGIKLKLLTKGKGVDVVINSNFAAEHLEATTSCISMFGFYIFLGTKEAAENEANIGMYMFLNNITFTYMPNSNEYFLNLPDETKASLHSRIEYGMREGAIRPLVCKVCKNFEPIKSSPETYKVKEIHECTHNNDIDTSTKWKTKLHLDDKHSYIIISNGEKVDLWFGLLKWLINRGARKFIIAIDDQEIASKFCNRVNRLLNENQGCSIMLTSRKVETIEDAKTLIVEANRMQPLEAVFFVALDGGEVTFQSVDKVTRYYPPVNFISLFSGGLKECEKRKSDGLPATLIHSENRVDKFSLLAPQLEGFFTRNQMQDETCLYELIDKAFVEKKIQTVCLTQLLSNDLDTLEDIGHRTTDELRFQEVLTLSRKYSISKGAYPLFVIPGIDDVSLKPLLENLIYPAFCATFTENCDSPSKSARQLLKHIQEIQPDGPVTILGDTWGGPVAIELASLLQSNKRTVRTFLVEGSPFTWQQRIKTLGQMNTTDFDFNLLGTMLNINLKEKLRSDLSWQDILVQHLNESQRYAAEKTNILKAVNGIRNRLMTLATYTQPQERLKHIVLYKEVLLESCLEKYSLSNEIHLFRESKHKDFLKNKDMAASINKKALFSWWR